MTRGRCSISPLFQVRNPLLNWSPQHLAIFVTQQPCDSEIGKCGCSTGFREFGMKLEPGAADLFTTKDGSFGGPKKMMGNYPRIRIVVMIIKSNPMNMMNMMNMPFNPFKSHSKSH